MDKPKAKQRVEFPDGHCQLVVKVTEDLDDFIVWLKRWEPNDPDWVYLSDLTWLETEGRWYCAKL